VNFQKNNICQPLNQAQEKIIINRVIIISMNKSRLIILVILLIAVAIGIYWSFSNLFPTQTPIVQTACTQEAKLCPDGSYVGRTGINCEFATCPTPTSTTPAETSTPGIAPYKSGIQGTVMLGPTCPVQKIPPDPKCADKPYQTMIAIFRPSDLVHAIAFTNSDTNGNFKLSLPPGDYTLGAGESSFPRCDHPQVTVGPNSYTTTTISCDTGIR
jgi:hypothetical protein